MPLVAFMAADGILALACDVLLLEMRLPVPSGGALCRMAALLEIAGAEDEPVVNVLLEGKVEFEVRLACLGMRL